MRTLRLCLTAVLVQMCCGCDDAAPQDAPVPDDARVQDPSDTGPTDAGPADASAADARVVDASPTDASAVDAGTTDAGTTDAGTTDAGTTDAGLEEAAPNLLLILADDYGLDWAACYGAANLPDTPTLNALCARGLVFENAWANPVCSPTRATALTGRYAPRTGIGSVVGGRSLNAAELTLPTALADSGYTSALIGKWHLGGDLSAPNDFGFAHFSGLFRGGLPDYRAWTKVVDGVEVDETRYATTAQVDDALAWLQQQDAQAGPWFLQMAFTAPHSPFHVPPEDLYRVALPANPSNSEQYHAMIEAMDTELARLLAAIDLDNTVVVFIGDNGTPRQVARDPVAQNRAKDTLYEGGIHVPMIAAGPGITAGRTTSLANVTDVWRTFVDLAGGDATADDAVSLRPVFANSAAHVRTYLRSDLFGSAMGNGRTARDATHKLIQFDDNSEMLFDLSVNPWETVPLDLNDPTHREIRDRLVEELDRIAP